MAKSRIPHILLTPGIISLIGLGVLTMATLFPHRNPATIQTIQMQFSGGTLASEYADSLDDAGGSLSMIQMERGSLEGDSALFRMFDRLHGLFQLQENAGYVDIALPDHATMGDFVSAVDAVNMSLLRYRFHGRVIRVTAPPDLEILQTCGLASHGTPSVAPRVSHAHPPQNSRNGLLAQTNHAIAAFVSPLSAVATLPWLVLLGWCGLFWFGVFRKKGRSTID